MLTLEAEAEARGRDDHGADLSELIEAIGGAGFAEQLVAYFDRKIGADHCSVFRLQALELTEVAVASLSGAAAMPRTDLSAYEIKRHLSQVRPGPSRFEMVGIADPCAGNGPGVRALRRHRLMIAARRGDAAYCIRILRSAHRDPLDEAALERLRRLGEPLVSLAAKQSDLTIGQPNVSGALSSLREIEACLIAGSGLSRREGEVCARILFGLSSCGIALDLAIGKESVMTYRKRAYQRLGIGSQRELLIWYLALWTKIRTRVEESYGPSLN